jgi:hypothetical protein
VPSAWVSCSCLIVLAHVLNCEGCRRYRTDNVPGLFLILNLWHWVCLRISMSLNFICKIRMAVALSWGCLIKLGKPNFRSQPTAWNGVRLSKYYCHSSILAQEEAGMACAISPEWRRKTELPYTTKSKPPGRAWVASRWLFLENHIRELLLKVGYHKHMKLITQIWGEVSQSEDAGRPLYPWVQCLQIQAAAR